jgi:ethanolamine utilization protein EutA
MAATTTLVGLDFGTTTTSALVAEGLVRRNVVTGRMELTVARETFRSPLVFTPLEGDRLDLAATLRLVDDWLARGGIVPGVTDIGGGGALLTGLTARRDNAVGLVAAIRARLGGALVATADDPCLESWLAFQGSCASLSRRHPEAMFLHLDIGGGTTNLAAGIDGNVLATGCLFVGARHVRFETGSRRIEALSPQARDLFAALDIAAAPGDDLAPADLERILDWYLALLDAAVAGEAIDPAGRSTLGHVQIPFLLPSLATGSSRTRIVTLSGGVGEMVYAAARGAGLPGTTAYGDLGVDLARRLLVHPTWSRHWLESVPEGGGRATVAGLLRHATRISGATIHLPSPQLLPLADLPIVATIDLLSDETALVGPLGLARRSDVGAAIRVRGLTPTATAVRAFGSRLAAAFEASPWERDRPLVLLLDTDCGKALGQCATGWGRMAVPLVVVDELDLPQARWVSLGKERDGVVPVSFHGLEG